MPPHDIVFGEVFSHGVMHQLHDVIRDLEEVCDNLDDDIRYGLKVVENDWLYIFYQAVESI